MDWQQQVSKQEEQERKKKKPTTFTNDESLQRKVEAVCDGLLPNVAALFMELSDTNKKAIAEFILDLVHRKNVAVNTKGIHLKNLVYLTRFWKGMELQDMKQDHNQENRTRMMKQQEEEKKKKDRKVRVVSFRLSERDYERHLSMAKLCYENGLTKGPDIVSYIRLSMECLSRYITLQAEAERSAEEKGGEQQQQQSQIKKEGSVEQQHDLNNYHTMTAPSSSSSRAAATAAAKTNTAAMGGEQHTRESIARTTPQQQPQPSPPTPPLFNNLREYFQPVFDQLDKLNKMLDSHMEEEEKIINPKRKRNDDSTVSDAHV